MKKLNQYLIGCFVCCLIIGTSCTERYYPELTVLGFFLVAGVDEKRVFVDAPKTLDLYQADCYYDYEGYQYLYLVHSSLYPIYIAEGPEGFAVMPAGCLDCRDRGGDIVRPSYWVD